MAVDRDGNIIDPFNLRLDTDPKMLRDAMAQYDSLSGVTRPGMPSMSPEMPSVNEMITPEFAPVDFLEAGELPSLDLNLTDIIDPQVYLEESAKLSPEVELAITEETQAVIENAEAGDEEDGIRAVSALALDNAPGLIEEKEDAYRNLSDIIDTGGLPAVEEFIRSMYTEGDNKESIPEWALPATVFGTFMMNEPGDWRQAYLQAKGKTATFMFNKRNADATAKAAFEKEIKDKALELYMKRQPDAKDLLTLLGKVTPESLDKYSQSGRINDLKLVEEMPDNNELLENFTAESVAAFSESGNYADLTRLTQGKDGKDTMIEYLKLFTPDSVKAWEDSGDVSKLVPKKDTKDNKDLGELTGLLETYTADSVQDFINNDYDFTRLTKKKDDGLFTIDDAYGSSGEQMNKSTITSMASDNYINKLVGYNENQKLDQLNIYASLYKATTEQKLEKTGALDTLKQQTPFVNVTPREFAERIGLDINNDRVAEIIQVPEMVLPTVPKDIHRSALALDSLDRKLDVIGQIYEAAPKFVTGVGGEILDSNAYRAVSDLLGFPLPVERTMASVITNVAEIDMIEAIIKEERFTDKDRQMVREFISGRSFKNIDEARLRLAEIKEVVAREKTVIDNQIKGNYRPIEYKSDTPGIGLEDKERMQKLLELSQKKT